MEQTAIPLQGNTDVVPVLQDVGQDIVPVLQDFLLFFVRACAIIDFG
jgi:hypothetical protein